MLARVCSMAKLVGIFVLLFAVGCSQASDVKPLSITGEGKTIVLQVETAVTDKERARGLMYRRTMDDDAGMIFDFEAEQPVSMWMRNTYVSLDMIFIHDDGRIGQIAENTTPLSDTIISSKADVRFVLEIKGGRSRQLGIEPGDRVHGPAIDELR